MNILADALPETVTIDGEQWPISTDFRACLRTILAFEDPDLTPNEKQIIMLSNLYPDFPENAQAAIERAAWFLNGGKPSTDDNDGPRVYSFSQDANFIFAAFRQTHGIDLQTEKMHWWKFLALFMDLGQDTTFCNLIGLRKRVKTGKASKEERAAAREMGEMFEVPEIDTRTTDEKEQAAEFERMLGVAQ